MTLFEKYLNQISEDEIDIKAVRKDVTKAPSSIILVCKYKNIPDGKQVELKMGADYSISDVTTKPALNNAPVIKFTDNVINNIKKKFDFLTNVDFSAIQNKSALITDKIEINIQNDKAILNS